MYEKIEKPLPAKCRTREGVTNSLRSLEYRNDCFEMPAAKRGGVYSIAKKLGIRITVRDSGKGVLTVWRIDAPDRPERELTRAEQLAEVRKYNSEFFDSASGQSAPSTLKPAPAPAPKAASKSPGRYVSTPYGPNIFIPNAEDEILR